MVLKALKFGVPVAMALGLAFHMMTPAFASGPIGISNLSGAAGDCKIATNDAACATLFQGNSVMYPGKAPETASVTIGYHTQGTTASTLFGVYLSAFASRAAASSPMCSAGDPADRMNLTITQGATVVYQGSLSAFARDHHDTGSILHLRGGHDGSGTADRWSNGDSSQFTIKVGLDISADNAYMGCVTTTDIAWFAG